MESPPCRLSGLASFWPPTQTFKRERNKEKWYFRVISWKPCNQRHQVEDRGPRDRKVSQDTDAADQERGEKTMGLVQPWGTSGTRLWTTNFSRALKNV